MRPRIAVQQANLECYICVLSCDEGIERLYIGCMALKRSV